MAGSFDATLKQLLDACAADWVQYLAPVAGLPASVGVDPLDAELSTVQPTADKVFRLRPPHAGLLHIEPQSSWDGEFADRLLLYNVLLEHRYGGPVHTVALLLRREAVAAGLGGPVTRRYADGTEYLRFGYAVVRVWELPADVLMAGGLGATPLALLTDDAEPRLPALVSRFADRVDREAGSAANANLLLSCAFILLGLRYDKVVAEGLFRGVQKMRESSTYQAILDEGRAEGRAEAVARAAAGWPDEILSQHRERFGAVPPEVEAKVRETTDIDRLRAALRQVLRVATPGDLPL